MPKKPLAIEARKQSCSSGVLIYECAEVSTVVVLADGFFLVGGSSPPGSGVPGYDPRNFFKTKMSADASLRTQRLGLLTININLIFNF